MFLLLLLLCVVPLGCSANCLRDTDCMGASVCIDNRCLLIASGDAGRPSTSSTSTPGDTSPADPDAPGVTPDGGAADDDVGN